MKTTAKPTVRIEVSGLGSWGKETTIDQIVNQAIREAQQKIRKVINGDCTIEILGDPEIEIVCVPGVDGGAL